MQVFVQVFCLLDNSLVFLSNKHRDA